METAIELVQRQRNELLAGVKRQTAHLNAVAEDIEDINAQIAEMEKEIADCDALLELVWLVRAKGELRT
jgi:septal ring factor EnvC (AmiA/AmiB activator)